MKNLLVLTVSLVVSLAALGTSTVHAQSPELLLQEGLELRRQHRDADALVRFEAAYRIGQTGQSLAQIALAEQALGRFAAAEVHMTTAISMQDQWIGSRRPQLQQALAQIQGQLGTVQVAGAPQGAVVYVNGEARGTLPEAANLRVRAGSVVIEVRAEGYATVQRSVQVQASGVWRENLAMVQLQAGQAQPGPVAQPGPGVQQSGPGGQPYQPAYQTQQQVETHPRWGLFIAGTAIFAGLWLSTGLIDLALDGEGIGFIPIAGPFILLDEVGDDTLFTILIVDGIAQLAGITLAVLGLVLQTEEVVMALNDDPEAPVLTLVPSVSPIAGLSETGLSGRALSASAGTTVGATLQLSHF